MIKKIALGLSILFSVFVSLFALDVFGQKGWIWELIIHLIPTLVIIILTVVSWKKEFLGGILWLVLGILFIIMSRESWVIYVPMIIIGGLNLWVGKIENKKS